MAKQLVGSRVVLRSLELVSYMYFKFKYTLSPLLTLLEVSGQGHNLVNCQCQHERFLYVIKVLNITTYHFSTDIHKAQHL
jgi:hypothetical protein